MTRILYIGSPGVLLRVLEALGDESKVLAHLQPQVRLRHPAVVGVDGMVLGQLLGYESARWKRQEIIKLGQNLGGTSDAMGTLADF